MEGTIFDITRASFVDGPGLRTAVFFKRCNLRCAWCHNPESQSADPQILFYKNKCRGCGTCVRRCPTGAVQSGGECKVCGECALFCPADARILCGRKITADEIVKEVEKDLPFYGEDGGVTFSGGECMLQLAFLKECLIGCKKCGIRTALDTAGDVPFSSFTEILPFTDLFLFDIKAFTPEIHKKYIGVENRRILENLSRLLTVGARVWIRIPVIGGVNDTEDEMRKIRDFLAPLPSPEKIELLPYHRMGDGKYAALGREIPAFCVPSPEKMKALNDLFSHSAS